MVELSLIDNRNRPRSDSREMHIRICKIEPSARSSYPRCKACGFRPPSGVVDPYRASRIAPAKLAKYARSSPIDHPRRFPIWMIQRDQRFECPAASLRRVRQTVRNRRAIFIRDARISRAAHCVAPYITRSVRQQKSAISPKTRNAIQSTFGLTLPTGILAGHEVILRSSVQTGWSALAER